MQNNDDSERWDATTPYGRHLIRDASREMLLKGNPTSPQGRELVGAILAETMPNLREQRPTSRIKSEAAVGAVLADLMIAADIGVWSRRSLMDGSFTGPGVGRTFFHKARTGLDQAGLLQSFSGFNVRQFSEFAGRETAWGGQSCFAPTRRLLDKAFACGIKRGEALDHFTSGRPVVGKDVPRLVLRGMKTRTDEGTKRQGPNMLFDAGGPKPKAILEAVEALNAYLDTKRIAGVAFGGLCRIFNDGDVGGFDWQRGGRHYTLPGTDGYQWWKGGKDKRRAAIRIEGESVAEADISGSHLSILSVLVGCPIDSGADPYAIPGAGRDQVKRWVTTTLGKGEARLEGRWYAKVRDATLSRYPFFADLPSFGITALNLQFHEAEILDLAMRMLRDEHDVAALPVFDSLVVPESKHQAAVDCLKAAFRDYLTQVTGAAVDTEPLVR